MPGTIAHINRGFMFCKLCQCHASGGKDPQWYAVHEGDATMLIQGSVAWTKKINSKIPIISEKACTFKLRKIRSHDFIKRGAFIRRGFTDSAFIICSVCGENAARTTKEKSVRVRLRGPAALS